MLPFPYAGMIQIRFRGVLSVPASYGDTPNGTPTNIVRPSRECNRDSVVWNLA